MKTDRCMVINAKGMTLVELMIVLVLSIFLMGAVYMTFQLQHRSAQSQTEVADLQNDIRVVLDIIALDIMHAGLSRNASHPIQGIPADTSGAGTLALQMDLDNDGATNSPGELVIYSLDNNNLLRDDARAGVIQVIASNVTALNFQYMGLSADGLTQAINPGAGTLDDTQADSVKSVNVTVSMQSEKADNMTGSFVQRTLSKWVARRNGVIQEL
jgi:Tfp pilus assembly protein PilW